jgi:hypothetical protein
LAGKPFYKAGVVSWHLGCPAVLGRSGSHPWLDSGAGEVVKLYRLFMFNGIMGFNQSLITIFYSIQKKHSDTQ